MKAQLENLFANVPPYLLISVVFLGTVGFGLCKLLAILRAAGLPAAS